VDEDFRGIRRQGGREVCNVPEGKEGSSCDVVGVGEEREGGVEDVAEVADPGAGGDAGGDDGAIDVEREGPGVAVEGVGAEFEKV